MVDQPAVPHHTHRLECRVCRSRNLQKFLSLGPSPLANSFLHSPTQFVDETKYPLDVFFCENCSLVQLLDVIDPDILFRNYIYLTGTSETIAEHNRAYAMTLVELLDLQKQDLVVEVASNDGSLLKCFQTYNIRTLGIEPATNIAEIANQGGVDTVNEFFNVNLAVSIRKSYQPARIVIGNNVLAHVDNPLDFLLGFKDLLTQDGLAVLQVPYLGHLLERLEYDTIYHEHLSYFSISTLKILCESIGLVLLRIDHVPVHGGSLRMYAGLKERYGNHTPEVMVKIEEERQLGLQDLNRYHRFSKDVARNREALLYLLERIKRQKKTIAGYGAPAKGNTLLNYCTIGSDTLPYTVDKSPLKIGLFTPGMHIPVYPTSALLEQQPDFVLILAWNFADEIMKQQQEYHQRGGSFIIPIPEPRIIK